MPPFQDEGEEPERPTAKAKSHPTVKRLFGREPPEREPFPKQSRDLLSKTSLCCA